MTSSIRYILGTIVIALAIGVGIFVYIDRSQTDGITSPSPTVAPNDAIGTFTSKELGISFQYAIEQAGGQMTKVSRLGDKVYISVGDMAVETGQFVEVFTKNANETFADAIRRRILANYPSSKCTIEVAPSNIQGGYWVAEIGYPATPESEGPPWANASLCNEAYAKTNGIRYFLYDPKHPTEFVYLDIGQYFIQGPGEIPWQHTLTFID